MPKVLFIANGHGEDVIAASIIKELQVISQDVDVYGLPMVGVGLALSSLPNVSIIGPQKEMRSGGFIKSVVSLWHDLWAGLIGLHFRQIKNATKHKYELVVAVGDFFPYILALLFLRPSKLVLISTAKSDLFEPHFFLERLFFRIFQTLVITRDQITADNLSASKVMNEYLGNVMMDLVPEANSIIEKQGTVVGILPGSRFEAYNNFRLIMKVVKNLPRDWHYICAVPDTIRVEQLDLLAVKVDFVSFAQLVNSSDLVIGLAGTANEQCIGKGVPVFCFPGTGPQTTRKRFRDQNKLLKGLTQFIDSTDSAIIAKRIEKLAATAAFCDHVNVLGPKVMGSAGGSKKIAEEIRCILESLSM